MNIRTICYRAFCAICKETVSPAPRVTEEEADGDLVAHVNIQHAPESHDSEEA